MTAFDPPRKNRSSPLCRKVLITGKVYRYTIRASTLANCPYLAFRLMSKARQPRGHRVCERAVEEVCVVPARHPGIGVPEQLADREPVGPGLSEQRSVGVPQLVEADGRDDLRFVAGIFDRPDVVILPPRLTVRLGEHQYVTGLAGDRYRLKVTSLM